MADNESSTPSSDQQVALGATAEILAGNVPRGIKPGTGSYARETCEKDDCVVKNPEVMEDYRKAVAKQNRDLAAAEGGLREGSSGGTSEGKDEETATAKP